MTDISNILFDVNNLQLTNPSIINRDRKSIIAFINLSQRSEQRNNLYNGRVSHFDLEDKRGDDIIMPINTGNINDLYNLEIIFRGQDSKKIILNIQLLNLILNLE